MNNCCWFREGILNTANKGKAIAVLGYVLEVVRGHTSALDWGSVQLSLAAQRAANKTSACHLGKWSLKQNLPRF